MRMPRQVYYRSGLSRIGDAIEGLIKGETGEVLYFSHPSGPNESSIFQPNLAAQAYPEPNTLAPFQSSGMPIQPKVRSELTHKRQSLTNDLFGAAVHSNRFALAQVVSYRIEQTIKFIE